MDALFLLAVLACPIGMGLMMWFMSKGMRGQRSETDASHPGSVDDLRAEQARLAAEIDRLELDGKGESDRAAPARR